MHFTRLRTIVYSITGGLITIILIRLLLKFIGANPSTIFVSFWYGLSDLLVGPWEGIYPNLVLSPMTIETYSVIAIIFFVLFGVIIDKALSIFRYDASREIIIAIVDLSFKLMELVIASRFAFKLFGASTSSVFVRFIYAASSIIYEPFAGIIKDLVIEGVLFEISTLLVLIIIIIFDVISENILESILGRPEVKSVK